MRSFTLKSLLFALLTGTAGAACSPPMMNRDAQPDGPTTDAAVEDRGVNADAGTCNQLPVVDLNTVGTVRSENSVRTTRYVANNSSAPEGVDLGLQIPPADEPACSFGLSREQVYRYTLLQTATLRVSTRNPGTDATFDSVIAMAKDSCDQVEQLVGCGDDDPRFDSGDPAERGMSTTIISANNAAGARVVLPAGTTVYIAVAGFRPLDRDPENNEVGTYELSVQELVPQMEGGTCDPLGIDGVCREGMSCVRANAWDTTGVCRPYGTVVGALCNGPSCADGLTCDLTDNVCYETVAMGEACDPTHRCPATASCVSSPAVLSGQVGTCRPRGSTVGGGCNADGTCAQGLRCVPRQFQSSVCQLVVNANARCLVNVNACPTGQSCVADQRGGLVGTCRDRGTVAGALCRAVNACDSGLVCPSGTTTDTCRATPAIGAQCDRSLDVCGASGTCVGQRLIDRVYGVCVAGGSAGQPCTGLASCMQGLTCSQSGATRGTCVSPSAAGANCTPLTECEPGTACVYANGPTQSGTCRREGEAGAPCRNDASDLCDEGLVCNGSPPSWICQRPTVDGTCDPTARTVACQPGTMCASIRVDAGRCVTPTAEREPNDSSRTATRLMLPSTGTNVGLVRGALYDSDIDCYSLSVPDGASLYAEMTYPSGLCPSPRSFDTAFGIAILDGSDVAIGSDVSSGVRGCPRIDGNDPAFPWARNLRGGTYKVCVRNRAVFASPVSSYLLSVMLSAP